MGDLEHVGSEVAGGIAAVHAGQAHLLGRSDIAGEEERRFAVDQAEHEARRVRVPPAAGQFAGRPQDVGPNIRFRVELDRISRLRGLDGDAAILGRLRETPAERRLVVEG